MFQRKPNKITPDDPPSTKGTKGFSSYVGSSYIAAMSPGDCSKYLSFLSSTEQALSENIYYPGFSKIVEQQLVAKSQQLATTSQQVAAPGASSSRKTYRTFPKT